MVPYVPKPQRGSAVDKGYFPKAQFRYDAGADTYMCPGGAALSRVRSRPVRGEVRVFDYANAALPGPAHSRRAAPARPAARLRATRTRPCLTGWRNGLARAARGAGRAPRERRASVRIREAMDGPGRIPDAQAGKRARRVQPDGQRHQSAPGHQPCRYSGVDCGRQAVKAQEFSQYQPIFASRDLHRSPRPKIKPLIRISRRKPTDTDRSPAHHQTSPGFHTVRISFECAVIPGSGHRQRKAVDRLCRKSA